MMTASFRNVLRKPILTAIVASMIGPNFSMLSQAKAQASNGRQDAISVLLEAVETKNPRLLIEVRQRLAKENLPAEMVDVINNLLLKIESEIGSGPYPMGSGGVNYNGQAASTGGSTYSTEPSTLESAISNISQARVESTASNIETLIRSRTNQTPIEIDQREQAYRDQNGTLLTGFVKSLRQAGVISSTIAQDNQALREKYDTIDLNILANHIINDAALFSGGIGAMQGMTSLVPQITRANLGQRLGLTVEAVSSFAVNANMILRLANLYGLKLSDYQEEILVLGVYGVFKLAIKEKLVGPALTTLVKWVGGKFAEARSGKTPAASGQKLMGAILNKAGLPVLPVVAAADDGKAASSPVPAPTHNAPTAAPKSQRNAVLSALAHSAANAAYSATETKFMGWAARVILEADRQRERELKNESFRSYLMSSNGEAFTKLLVVAMNASANPPGLVDILRKRTAPSDFIVNLARSSRVCSAEEAMLLNSQASQAEITKVSGVDWPVLQFACDHKLGVGRYNRMVKEFQTNNAIPQEYITDLRISGRENRLRMAEILMQFQYLDGDRDPIEVAHFNTVVTKILGFEDLNDRRYFDRFESYIREQGGMVVNSASPMGYSVAKMTATSPYNLRIGYTPVDGPDASLTTPPSPPPLIPNTSPIPSRPTTPPASPGTPTTPTTTSPTTTRPLPFSPK